MSEPSTSTSSASSQPQRQWVSFEDPTEQRTWMFDVTFLESSWNCIFGSGGQGIGEERDPDAHLGCCSHGAYFSDEADRQRVEAVVQRLDEASWQFAAEAERLGGPVYRDGAGDWRTRIFEDACIFQNRTDHPRGPGCALHQLAIAEGTSHVDTKPEVCWQVPVRREDHETETGHVFTMVREWERKDWGDGGPDFGWWCTEAPEAFEGARPVYLDLAEELAAICGQQIYDAMREILDERRSSGRASAHPVHLGMPTRPKR